MGFIQIAVLLSFFACAFGQDWCKIASCRQNQHIACNNNGNFYSSCREPVALKLTSNQINMLVNGHNDYRNKVASGNLPGFSSARRMAKLTWNSQLAQFAELNTRQCIMKHDACHNTAAFKFSGQNLASMGTSATYTIEQVIKGSLEMWFNEYKDATMANIDKVGGAPEKGVIGHFTAMVTERSTQVGCGLSSYKTTSGQWTFTNYLLACNYASTNMIGWPVYKTGPAASGCTGGRDTVFSGLCKTTEPIDPNSN